MASADRPNGAHSVNNKLRKRDEQSMSADRYRRIFGDFTDKVAKVSPERWGAPTPCEDWTCSPSVDVEPDADDQTKLLALLGRHV
jgi:hypothetical protein